MHEGKKFISPGGWFSMVYPSDWNEFEDTADSFLFYNPDKWTGNFRISAFRESPDAAGSNHFGDDACQSELDSNVYSEVSTVGAFKCAYSKEYFEEEEKKYVTHVWITGKGDTSLECTFTTVPDGDIDAAEKIISSIEIREAGKKYPAERIPIRLSEIYQIDEAFKWTSDLVKNQLTVDFQGIEEDLNNIQRAITKSDISPKKREAWINIGITICCIIANEVEGTTWNTLMDGNREAPVLVYNEVVVDPLKLVWSKVKNQQPVDVVQTYGDVIASLS